MKIRAQFLLTMFLFGLVLIIMAASVVITYQLVDQLNQQSARLVGKQVRRTFRANQQAEPGQPGATSPDQQHPS